MQVMQLRNANSDRPKGLLRKRYRFGYLPLKPDNLVAQRSRPVLVGALNQTLR
jgi:hypothetical protein